MKNPGISIIIPCYNSGSYVIDAVDSVLKQPFKCAYELIVIDDGSTDEETKNNLISIEKSNNTSVIRFENNKGVQHARNEGLKAAKFDYIMPLDADDSLNTDINVLSSGTYADNAIKVLEERDDVAFVYAISNMFKEYTGYTISAYPVTAAQILNKHHAQTSIIYRKEDAVSAGFYNPSILKWQDWSFAVSLLNARFKENKENNIYFLEKPYHLYRIHSSSSRISSKNLSELEMTRLTIQQNPDIFSSYFPNITVSEIANKVISGKPNKLVDLLYIAANNISTALFMAKERGYKLHSEIEPENIP